MASAPEKTAPSKRKAEITDSEYEEQPIRKAGPGRPRGKKNQPNTERPTGQPATKPELVRRTTGPGPAPTVPRMRTCNLDTTRGNPQDGSSLNAVEHMRTAEHTLPSALMQGSAHSQVYTSIYGPVNSGNHSLSFVPPGSTSKVQAAGDVSDSIPDPTPNLETTGDGDSDTSSADSILGTESYNLRKHPQQKRTYTPPRVDDEVEHKQDRVVVKAKRGGLQPRGSTSSRGGLTRTAPPVATRRSSGPDIDTTERRGTPRSEHRELSTSVNATSSSAPPPPCNGKSALTHTEANRETHTTQVSERNADQPTSDTLGKTTSNTTMQIPQQSETLERHVLDSSVAADADSISTHTPQDEANGIATSKNRVVDSEIEAEAKAKAKAEQKMLVMYRAVIACKEEQSDLVRQEPDLRKWEEDAKQKREAAGILEREAVALESRVQNFPARRLAIEERYEIAAAEFRSFAGF